MVKKDVSKSIAGKDSDNTKIAQSKEEEESLEIKKGEANEDVYSEEGLEEMEESDEIEPYEEGFMEGESHEGIRAKCAKCGKALLEPKGVIEKKADGKRLYFCSEKCADGYKPRKYED